MQFTSNTFIFMFLPACMLLYFVMPSIKGKNAVLLLASLLFYALGEPLYILLMLLETLIGYLTGWMLARAETINYRRGRILLMSIVLLALPLVVFKYTGFFIDNLNKIFSLKLTVPQLPLPVGISFYTFQLIGYVADVERKKIPAERSYLRLLLFVSLFPQLVQGPILRYPDIEKQIKERKSDPKQIADGITRFIFGFGKKVIISNEIAKTVDMVFAKGFTDKPVLMVWLGMICYALQIYFDFSGYSDMALGLGKMFGFEFKENFNYPYLSKSVSEFWRRWHISLGSFFRDYVYIPLGGNRKHQLFNLFVVWALTGFWHGASWNFILWGLYFFILLCIEKFLLKGAMDRMKVLNHVITLILLVFGWAIFYFEDMSQCLLAIKTMLFMSKAPLWDPIYNSYLLNNSAVLAIAILGCFPLGKLTKRSMELLYDRNEGMWFAFTLVFDALILFVGIAGLVGSGYNPFLYFRF